MKIKLTVEVVKLEGKTAPLEEIAEALTMEVEELILDMVGGEDNVYEVASASVGWE